MVYCHNSTPFKKVLLKDLFFQPVVFFFSLFYKFLYQINIHKNDYVVVQQVWFKKAFIKLFGLDPEKVLVCYPETENNGKGIPDPNIRISEKRNDVFTFFYPSLPRPFKNFELIAEAILMLQEKGVKNFKVIITISGTENNYSKYIYKKYSSIPQLDFIGRISLEHVHQLYHSTDALLFPSTLETWGLPISEFKAYHKPMLVSGLPYAQESVGSYDKVMFFDPARASDLSEKMAALISDQPVYAITREADEEVLRGWPELFKKVLNT